MLAKKAARKLPLLTGLAAAVVLTRAPDALLGTLHLSGNPLAASIFEVHSIACHMTAQTAAL